MKRIILTAALALMMTSGTANAGQCEEQTTAYNKHVAEQTAEFAKTRPKGSPEAKEANDKWNERMKANILKGCEPGGYFEQLDKAIRDVKAECAAHPGSSAKSSFFLEEKPPSVVEATRQPIGTRLT